MHPRRLRGSSLKYSRYCTPPCTTRTVGAPPVGRRALPPGRLARLGATPDFHHGLLRATGAAVCWACFAGPAVGATGSDYRVSSIRDEELAIFRLSRAASTSRLMRSASSRAADDSPCTRSSSSVSLLMGSRRAASAASGVSGVIHGPCERRCDRGGLEWRQFA